MSYIEKEKLIKADIASIENRVRHAFNQGYDLGYKEGKERAKPQEQEPTTKNDKVDCEHTDCNNCVNHKYCDYESTTKNDLALLEKTYDDFCKCEGGEGWLKIDGKKYGTDVGYAIEGVDIFMEVFKRRLAELPSVTPQEPKTGYWINKQRLFDSCSAECSSCHKRSNGYVSDNGYSLECKYFNFCPNCGCRMVEPQESDSDVQ